MMEGGANEVRYKIAEFLLKRMHEERDFLNEAAAFFAASRRK